MGVNACARALKRGGQEGLSRRPEDQRRKKTVVSLVKTHESGLTRIKELFEYVGRIGQGTIDGQVHAISSVDKSGYHSMGHRCTVAGTAKKPINAMQIPND